MVLGHHLFTELDLQLTTVGFTTFVSGPPLRRLYNAGWWALGWNTSNFGLGVINSRSFWDFMHFAGEQIEFPTLFEANTLFFSIPPGIGWHFDIWW